MERIDLYKPELINTGRSIVRGEKIPEDVMGLVVFICVFNSKGQMLIQKRDPRKAFGNRWDVSAGGAVSSGEDSLTAALRESEEELGIHFEEKDLTKLMTLYYDETVHDIYGAIKDINLEDLTLQEGEVIEARWVSVEELDAMIDSGEFLGIYKEYIHLLYVMKDQKGIMWEV